MGATEAETKQPEAHLVVVRIQGVVLTVSVDRGPGRLAPFERREGFSSRGHAGSLESHRHIFKRQRLAAFEERDDEQTEEVGVCTAHRVFDARHGNAKGRAVGVLDRHPALADVPWPLHLACYRFAGSSAAADEERRPTLLERVFIADENATKPQWGRNQPLRSRHGQVPPVARDATAH